MEACGVEVLGCRIGVRVSSSAVHEPAQMQALMQIRRLIVRYRKALISEHAERLGAEGLDLSLFGLGYLGIGFGVQGFRMDVWDLCKVEQA